MPGPILEATKYFDEGCNCAQAVLAGFASRLGLDEETALKLASSFGGGVARRGQICGAVSGGLMALGMGIGDPSPAGKDANYARTGEFLRRFEALHQSILCRDLTGCDLTTPEGRQLASERDIHHTICTSLVRSAAQITAEMLDMGDIQRQTP